MRKPYEKIRLTDEEYEAVYRLAEQSKIDCWFAMKDYNNCETPHTVVYDLERGYNVSLQYGIRLLLEGISWDDTEECRQIVLNDYGLSDKQYNIVKNLITKLKIKI